MKSNEVFAKMQKEILGLMKTEGQDWTKSWIGVGVPTNFTSKKAYRGINQWWLAIQGYKSNEWGTFKQWKEKGYQVKKGSKSTPIIFSSMQKKKESWLKDEELVRFKATGELPSYFYWKSWNVFNADQVEGYTTNNEVKDPKRELTIEEVNAIQSFIDNTGANIVIGGDVACYKPSQDEINMPHIKQFFSDSEYFAVTLHELTHWTKHESRTNRDAKDLSYAEEELVAEIGSAFLSQLLGVEKSVRPCHAKYLNNWIEAIEDSEKAMIQAFSMAQKAVDFLTNTQEKKKEKAA